MKQNHDTYADQVLFLGFEGHHYQSLYPNPEKVNESLLESIRTEGLSNFEDFVANQFSTPGFD